MKALKIIFFFAFVFFSGEIYANGAIVLVLSQDVSQYKTVFEGVTESIENNEIKVDFRVVNIDKEKEFQEVVKEKDIYDLIVSIGTKSSKIAVKEFNDIPVIFVMVLNPVKEGIIDLSTASRRIVTGVSARVKPESYLKYAKKIQPPIKRIGILYTRSLFQDYISLIKTAAADYGIMIIDKEVSSKKEFIGQFNSVIREDIDSFLILPDFNIYDINSIRYVLLNTFKSKIPCIGPSNSFVKAGALWGFDISPFNIGKQVSKMIDKVLKKNEVPWEYYKSTEVIINMIIAEKLNVKINNAVLKEVKVVEKETK